jgi:hypothetical protein
MGLFYLIGFILALLIYALIIKNQYESIIDLVEYSNNKKIKIFNKIHSSYFSAISDGDFVDKLVFTNRITNDAELNLILKKARRKFRLMFFVNLLLVVAIFVIF